MLKKEISINIDDFPDEIHWLFNNSKIYDSSSHPTMKVLYCDSGYYLKIAEKDVSSK